MGPKLDTSIAILDAASPNPLLVGNHIDCSIEAPTHGFFLSSVQQDEKRRALLGSFIVTVHGLRP